MKSDVYSLSNLRSDNRSLIFKYVRKAPISRSDIAKNAGICKSSVTALTNQMINQGLLTEIGAVDTGVGRRPVLLDIVADYGYAIGVSIGSDNFVCISDLKSNVITFAELDSEKNLDKISEAVREKITDILSKTDIPLTKCIGIGISITEGLDNIGEDIKNYLECSFSLPVRVDTPTAILCMSQVDIYNGASLVIRLGENIRSGIAIDGNIRIGGNIEHFSIDCNGKVCDCGNRGCLGKYISGHALREMFRKDIYADALEDEETVEYIADKLSYALVSIRNLFALQRVIVCGSSKDNGEVLISNIKRHLHDRLPQPLEILWVDVSSDTVKNSVCAAIINDYFVRQ